MHCPKCGQPVPANEWAAYGRHEDCHAVTSDPNLPGTGHQPSKGKQPKETRDAGGGRRRSSTVIRHR